MVIRRSLVCAPALIFLIVGLVHIAHGPPLGHDEAVYALRAKEFAEGSVEGVPWAPYRAPGLPAILSLTWVFGASEAVMRSVVLSLGVVGIALTVLLAWRLFDPYVAVTSGVLLAVTPGYLRSSVQILADVPGAVLGLSAMVVFAYSVREQREIRYWVLLIVPITALATYVRFGAPIPIAVGLSALGLYYWPAVKRSIGIISTAAVATLTAVTGILFVPAMTGSNQSPQSAIQQRQVAKEGPWWTPAKAFWEQAESVLGFPLQVVVVTGIILAILVYTRRHTDAGSVIVIGASSALTILGLVSTLGHGEARYLSPVLPLVMILAAAGLVTLLGIVRLPEATLALMVLLAVSVPRLNAEAASVVDVLESRYGTIRTISWQIAEELPEDCAVLTTYTPQVGWYSECNTRLFPKQTDGPGAGDELRSRIEELDDEAVVMVFFEGGKRQPTGDRRTAFIGASEGLVFRYGQPGDPLQYGEVYRLR